MKKIPWKMVFYVLISLFAGFLMALRVQLWTTPEDVPNENYRNWTLSSYRGLVSYASADPNDFFFTEVGKVCDVIPSRIYSRIDIKPHQFERADLNGNVVLMMGDAHLENCEGGFGKLEETLPKKGKYLFGRIKLIVSQEQANAILATYAKSFEENKNREREEYNRIRR